MISVLINTIKVNQGRREVNVKKVSELADSIKQIGLLNPITISQDYTLIAGLHRLEAHKLLGYTEIKVNIVPIDGLLAELAEIDENLMREELHYIDRGNQLIRRKEIYEELHPETKKGAVNQHTKVLNAESAFSKNSFTSDTAQKTGRSRRSIQEEIQIANNIIPEAQEIIKQTELPKTEALKLARMEPEKQKDIVQKISNGEAANIRTAIIAINKECAEELNNNPLIIPAGKYRTIEIDPPWKLDGQEAKSQVMQYPLMDLQQIKDLGDKINEMADDNCHLYLWAINPMLPEAFEVIRAWEIYGFVYKTCITWVKSNGFGTGHYYRGQTEHVLLAVKGKLGTNRNDQANYFEAPRYKHSEKPEKFYEIVETMSPEPRIRLFARFDRSNWTSWGNEIWKEEI